MLAASIVNQPFASLRPRLIDALEAFYKQSVSSIALYHFELALLLLVRDLGRLMIQSVIQSLEPETLTGGSVLKAADIDDALISPQSIDRDSVWQHHSGAMR